MPDANSIPQFGTAEYHPKPGTDVCKLCSQPVGAQYYRVGSKMACGSCAERIQRETPKDTHAAFTRGLLFGVGGAILGLILYSAFTIITGWIIGYVSLAVGYIVGKAIMMGSRGIGGRRYQIAAVILTYAAVSMSAIPISIAYMVQHKSTQKLVQKSDQSKLDAQSEEGSLQAQTRPPVNLGAALLQLALLGLASPFLELFKNGLTGVIGLVILVVGIRIAWRIAQGTSEVTVYGPFENSAPAL